MESKNIINNAENEINVTSLGKNNSLKGSISINKSIKYYYQKPPLIGLQNLGHSDYMNAVIQCLSNIEQLTSYFKYDSYIKQKIKENTNSLVASYKLIIDNLWPNKNKYKYSFNNNKYYTPYDLKDCISQMNNIFKGIQVDVKDMIDFFIFMLHKELNRINNCSITLKYDIDKNNEKLIFDNFLQYFKSKNNSIIVDLFYGIKKFEYKCLKCNNTIYNFEDYFYICFPLEEIRRYKLTKLQENNSLLNQNEINFKIQLLNKNIVDIKDCFEHYQSTVIFSGDNSIFCNKCNEIYSTSFQSLLYILPQILIIILNRGKIVKHKIKLKFEELLDLSDYDKNGRIYELISVITHLGKYDFSGHYIAQCKSPIDNKWYRYNDAIVSEMNNFEKDILNFGEPYALFYKRQ